MPVCAEHFSRLMYDKQTRNSHKRFLQYHQPERHDHKRETGEQAEQHCRLSQLIRHRIQHFPKVAGHVEMPCHKAVHSICYA